MALLLFFFAMLFTWVTARQGRESVGLETTDLARALAHPPVNKLWFSDIAWPNPRKNHVFRPRIARGFLDRERKRFAWGSTLGCPHTTSKPSPCRCPRCG